MRFVLVLILAVLAFGWEGKVDDRLLTKILSDSYLETSCLVLLKQTPLDTTNVDPLDLPAFVYKTLSAEAAQTQVGLIEYLEKSYLPYKSYWVANMVVTTVNITHLTAIANRDEVEFIEENKPFRVPLETVEEDGFDEESEKRQTGVEWNVNYVGAPTVWATGWRGEGLVVANADTGVQWTHPALISQYRGAANDHDYNWWDAIHTTGSSCGANSKEPCDDNGHGTHTTGTAVGWDQANNYIGVAPRAKWIACRNMNAGLGTPQTYIECLQWFIAPTKLDGTSPDPSKAPHVIGNSYGCPPSEGCSRNALNTATTNVINAGIFMSVSAGNSGSSCSSITDPPATVNGVCSVGALAYNSDTIASYSSRGPITDTDGTVRVGPLIAAPGSSVRSAYPTNRYVSLSGTSMASPAVTGSIALIWQAKPALVRKVQDTQTLLQTSAFQLDSTACQSSGRPNNVYGYGLLDIAKAIDG